MFSSLAGSGDSAPAALQVERYRLHRAVRAAIEQPGPLVVVLDDLDWADAASVELIAYLLLRPPEGAVLIALVYRDVHAPRALVSAVAAAERDGSLERLQLDPLSPEQAGPLRMLVAVSKRFAAVAALDGVDFGLRARRGARAGRGNGAGTQAHLLTSIGTGGAL